MTRSSRRRWFQRAPDPEAGQISLLILGFAVVVILLLVGTVAVTSVELSRVRLLDAADGAALDAADTLDPVAYRRGLGDAVALSDASVQRAARQPQYSSFPCMWNSSTGVFKAITLRTVSGFGLAPRKPMYKLCFVKSNALGAKGSWLTTAAISALERTNVATG